MPAAKTVAPTVPAASAPAVEHHDHDAAPVVEHHDHPKVAPVEHHEQKAASVEHHDAPKITPIVAPTKPSPKAVEHHDAAPVAPAQTTTPTPSVTPTAPAQLANVDAAPAHVNGKAISKILKLPRPLPQVHAFLPAGGVKGNAEVFLFLHGMFAHHDRSHDKGFRPGKDINDPNRAMAATTRNLVTLAPVAHFAGEWPLWRELADNKGFKELIAQSLDQLSSELSITPPITASARSRSRVTAPAGPDLAKPPSSSATRSTT